MTDEKKLTSLLGLAQKAGKLVSGEFAVEKAVKAGQAKLVIVAADCSEATKKSYRDMTSFYNITLYECLTKDDLGSCIGKIQRGAAAVTDSGFSTALKKLFDH